MLEKNPNYMPSQENQPRGRAERYAIFKQAESAAATIVSGIMTVYAAKHMPGVTDEIIFGSLTVAAGTTTGFLDRTRRRIKGERQYPPSA